MIKRGRFTLKAEPWIGTGVDREFMRYDLGVNREDGDADLILGRGGFVSLSYKASQKVNLAVGYGIDDPDADDMDGMSALSDSLI